MTGVESGRPTWDVEPGRGIGPLRIGMPIDAACDAIDAAGLGPAGQLPREGVPVYTSRHGAVVVYASSTDHLVVKEVETIETEPEPLQVVLFGRPLLGTPLDEVAELLSSVDARTERRARLVEAPGLGVRVWSGGDPPRWPVGSLTVARPTPPARVIAPGFAFDRLDRLARKLGFTGGATTVRAPLVAGEPEVAEWSDRHVLLRYTFDPVTFLRVIRIDGPDAVDAPAVQRLLAELPAVTDAQVLTDIGSDDDETALRAIQAAAVLRLAAAKDALRSRIQHGPELVRTAAVSTLAGLPDEGGATQ